MKKKATLRKKSPARAKPARTRGGAPDARVQLVRLVLAAKAAAGVLAQSSAEQRNRALEAVADLLVKRSEDVLFRNAIDVEAGRRAALSPALLDRLTLTPRRIQDMAKGLRDMIALPDPLGEIVEESRRPNGLLLQKVRVPLGVIAMVYEARPNVTVDSAGLCLKSGNAVVLRGGKEALDTNTVLAAILGDALSSVGLPAACAQLVPSTDRALIRDLATMDQAIDLLIPRGSDEMVRAIREMATVPVLSHGRGLCAVYVDKAADLAMAEEHRLQRQGPAAGRLQCHGDFARPQGRGGGFRAAHRAPL